MPSQKPHATADMTSAVISLEAISKTYRRRWRHHVPALRGVTLHVAPGEVFGLLGHNGAGKTTLMKLVLGLVRPTGGTGSVLGRPLGDRRARAAIGFQPEQPYLYPLLTVSETLAFFAELAGLRRRTRAAACRQAAARCGLGPVLAKRVGELSRGWLQRLALASAIVHAPRLILLDEPLGGLDPDARLQIKSLVRELRAERCSILLNSHLLPDVEDVADRIAILARGEIVTTGALRDLLQPDAGGIEVTVRGDVPASWRARAQLQPVGGADASGHARWLLPPEQVAALQPLLQALLAAGTQVMAVTPRAERLEQLYARVTAVGPDREGDGRHRGGPRASVPAATARQVVREEEAA